MKMIKEHSAGGAVYRKLQVKSEKPAYRTGRLKVCRQQLQILWLISKHSGYHKWVLPKGIVEQGETAEEAAVREVQEETGIKAEIIRKIDFEVKYKYSKSLSVNRKSQNEKNILVDKTVEFYLMKYVSGDTKDHNWEMEEAKWADGTEALNLLGFETEKEILRSAVDLISN